MSSAVYEWRPFYREFAEKLVDYKYNRLELIDKIYEIYKVSGIKMPTLDSGKKIADMDPFTVMGLFNKQISTNHRVKLLSAIAKVFDVKATVPTTFLSIPVLNNMNATYYYFVGSPKRKEEQIDTAWNLFETALKYCKNPEENRESFISLFDQVINLPGVGNSKLTMALYWIAPEMFMNLDSRSEWYIYESGEIADEVLKNLPRNIDKRISGKNYVTIVETVRSLIEKKQLGDISDFCDLSYNAWELSEKINREQKLAATNEVPEDIVEENDSDSVNYWIYSPGKHATFWEEYYEKGVMGIGWSEIGDLMQYESKDAIKSALKDKRGAERSYKGAAHILWQFSHVMKPGDIIYVKNGTSKLVGMGIVNSDCYFDEDSDAEQRNYRDVEWLHKGEWEHPGSAVTKTLTNITAYTEYIEKLQQIFGEEEDIELDSDRDVKQDAQKYTKEDFLNSVFMEEDAYNTLCELIQHKKNVILQGAPGVGKTYAAKRLAYSIMGEMDEERVEMVQFHQSYSYEDFIEGYRPNEAGTGFSRERGVFYKFCKRAEEDDPNNLYFFIIDEINRGNLSKIFGELFMLIEGDKRGVSLKLLYSKEKFSIPKNVRIIGMMNTADRSLAMLDYALRRRFAFFDMKPGFDSKQFAAYKEGLSSDKFNLLIDTIKSLNIDICNDESLGEGFGIGHSYFCGLTEVSEKELQNIVEYEIIPMLREYWFDEPTKVNGWSDRLRRAVQ